MLGQTPRPLAAVIVFLQSRHTRCTTAGDQVRAARSSARKGGRVQPTPFTFDTRARRTRLQGVPFGHPVRRVCTASTTASTRPEASAGRKVRHHVRGRSIRRGRTNSRPRVGDEHCVTTRNPMAGRPTATWRGSALIRTRICRSPDTSRCPGPAADHPPGPPPCRPVPARGHARARSRRRTRPARSWSRPSARA